MSQGSFGYIDEGSFKRLSQQLRRAENAPEPENREREEPGQVPYYVEFMGKLNGTLHSSAESTAAESTGAEASIWAAHSDHEPKDTTRDVTVYPWFLNSGQSISKFTKITAGSYGGKLYVTGVDDSIQLFNHSGESNIPAYAVVTGVYTPEGANNGEYVSARRPSTTSIYTHANAGYWVNGGADTDEETGEGWCSEASGRPVRALYDTDQAQPTTGELWGPIPDTWMLGQGLPGFVGRGGATGVSGTAWVRRHASVVYLAKATEDWVDTSVQYGTVTANPCIDNAGTKVYDGVHFLQDIEIDVILHRNGSLRDPNIKAGNVFAYAIAGDGDIAAVGSYLDDPIGTVKLWNKLTSNIPQGWQQVSSSAGKFLRAANAIGSGTFGSTGNSNNYLDYILIERFE